MSEQNSFSTPSATWRQFGEQDPHAGHYDCERAKLTMGHLTDDELANGAFLNYDQPLNVQGILAGTHASPIAWMTAVKDRIRWLSRALEQAKADRDALAAKLAAAQGMADTMEMLRSEMLAAGVIDPGVAPMFFPESIIPRLLKLAEMEGQEPVAWLNPYGGVLQSLSTGLERSTYTIPLYARPVPAETSPDFTDTPRAALLWVLWHHQGGSSPVGQPIRYALGMGAHDRLSDYQVQEAKRWAALTKSETCDFHRGHAEPPVNARLLDLLKEARSTFEMWRDVAPAVSLCADIDAAIAAAESQAGPARLTDEEVAKTLNLLPMPGTFVLSIARRIQDAVLAKNGLQSPKVEDQAK